MAVRLIDTHCNWLGQYAPETTTFSASAYTEIPDRLKQLGGYMTATAVAVLCCARAADDWERQPDPWRSLGELITRYEAEFAGRLLIGPTDFKRWQSEPADGLTWGMLGVSGLDYLVRDQADLKQLPGLFKRGVRVIQLVETARSRLAGSAEPGDDRALTDLGRACLSEIAALSSNVLGEEGRPILDVAHLNPRSMLEVIDAVQEAARAGGLLLMYSHGAVAHPGFDGPRALDLQNLARLRAADGLVGLTPGPPFHQSTEELQSAIDQVAAIPFEGRWGYEGIAIGSDFLDVDGTLADLGDALAVVEWVSRTFDGAASALLVETNALRLLAKAVGGEAPT
jgi:membrane dipeptidase